MDKLPPYVTLYKTVGQTPLECAEIWRKDKPEMQNVPLAYAGRLDPMAEGSLLVLIGEECKKQKDYHNLDKEYEFEILFGASSDSGDVLGLVNEAGQKNFNEHDISSTLKTLTGPIELPYPIFSSRTVKGKPLHTWTMEGRLDEITIPTKKSEIHVLELIESKKLSRAEIAKISLEKIETIPPVTDLRKALGNDFRRPEVRKSWQSFANFSAPEDSFTIAKIRCLSSSGTYMRTLAEVIAKELGSNGLAFSINRTKIGKYQIDKNTWQIIY